MMQKDIKIVDEVLARPIDVENSLSPISVTFGTCSVADLIRFRVEQEVARGEDAFLRFIELEEDMGAETERSLNDAKTNARMFSGAMQARSLPDVTAAVEKAFSAFQAGRFILLLNDDQAEGLDEEVLVTELDKVTFVRLIPLQGG